MILVDASVLIGYFKEQRGIPFTKFDFIINNEIPYGICDCIYQELLQGSRDEKEYKLLKEYLSTLPFNDLLYSRESFENAAMMYIKKKKKGITIKSTLDLIIAEIAIENNLYLLHDDKDFAGISNIYKNLMVY
jgi:predicted nucleic acid-binding protein